MTERKPAGVSFESWVDRQIREAVERGEFQDLPGKGRPIAGLDEPADELWWVKGLLQREGVSYTPPALSLRREVHDLQDRLQREPTESCVRRVVEELNARIRQANRMPPIDGPPTSVSPLDVDEVVERWKAGRPVATAPITTTPPQAASSAPAPTPPKRRWWGGRRPVNPSS